MGLFFLSFCFGSVFFLFSVAEGGVGGWGGVVGLREKGRGGEGREEGGGDRDRDWERREKRGGWVGLELNGLDWIGLDCTC